MFNKLPTEFAGNDERGNASLNLMFGKGCTTDTYQKGQSKHRT